MPNIEQPILAERAKQWGDPVETHERIARVWSGILDCDVTPQQVALMMTGLKLVRASVNPDEPDSYKDAKGYLSIAEMIILPDHPDLAQIRAIRIVSDES